jgi:NitT/TauT family transport system substrate-binding protein
MSDGEETLLRVGTTPKTAMSGLHLAHELGYFSEAGLNVEIHQMTRTPQMMPLLASGRFDASLAGINTAFINAVASGGHLRIVAGREITSTTCGSANTLYGNAQAFPQGINDLRLLKGKRISLRGRHTVSEFVLDTLLESVGMSVDDVELVFLRQQDGAAALLSGRIDVLLSSHFEKDPTAVSHKYVKGIGLANVLPEYQRSFIMFGPTLLQADREIGVRFLVAYLRGANDFVNGRTPKFLDELARASGRDPEEARKACRDTFVRDGRIDRRSIERFVKWARRKGYCLKRVRAGELIDDSYIIEAQKQFERLISSQTR